MPTLKGFFVWRPGCNKRLIKICSCHCDIHYRYKHCCRPVTLALPCALLHECSPVTTPGISVESIAASLSPLLATCVDAQLQA
eukprot:1148663-Pelagomonas_calceolata.AAC.8